MATTTETMHFPGETREYREKRNQLLKAELELRRQVEAVAAMRRELPLGGEVQDYTFTEAGGKTVRLSELFADGKDTLVLYNFMFGPKMAAPCPMCSSFLDGLNGNAHHLMQRINLAVVARSPIERIMDFATPRGWSHLRLLSSSDNTYNHDYHGEEDNGGQNPMMNVFVKRNGKIHHFWGSEVHSAPRDKGQDPRHIDMMWPLWNVLDLTPEGRGTDWYPKLK